MKKLLLIILLLNSRNVFSQCQRMFGEKVFTTAYWYSAYLDKNKKVQTKLDKVTNTKFKVEISENNQTDQGDLLVISGAFLGTSIAEFIMQWSCELDKNNYSIYDITTRDNKGRNRWTLSITPQGEYANFTLFIRDTDSFIIFK